MAHQHTLWGFRIPDEPTPIVLAVGTEQFVRTERDTWQAGGWTCDYYWSGAEPIRIRKRARLAQPDVVALWGSEDDQEPTELARGTFKQMYRRLLDARRSGWTVDIRPVDNVAQPTL